MLNNQYGNALNDLIKAHKPLKEKKPETPKTDEEKSKEILDNTNVNR
jgi:hypothetical protein